MRPFVRLCVLFWLFVYIFYGCAPVINEIKNAQQEFNNIAIIVENADLNPQKAIYYEKLKVLEIELSNLIENWQTIPEYKRETKLESITKQYQEIINQVQKELKIIVDEKRKFYKSNHHDAKYLNETLAMLNKPELNPDELNNIVAPLKIAEQKKEVFMGIFGLGGYQLSAKGQKRLKSFYKSNIKPMIAKISEENINTPLLLNLSFDILGYTDEAEFSKKSKKKLGRKCGISFKSSRKKNRKKLNQCLSKLRAAAVGEYFRELKKNSDAKGSNKMVKTNFIINPIGKGEEMPDDLKDGRPRDERRRICKIIFTYWREVQTK